MFTKLSSLVDIKPRKKRQGFCCIMTPILRSLFFHIPLFSIMLALTHCIESSYFDINRQFHLNNQFILQAYSQVSHQQDYANLTTKKNSRFYITPPIPPALAQSRCTLIRHSDE